MIIRRRDLSSRPSHALRPLTIGESGTPSPPPGASPSKPKFRGKPSLPVVFWDQIKNPTAGYGEQVGHLRLGRFLRSQRRAARLPEAQVVGHGAGPPPLIWSVVIHI